MRTCMQKYVFKVYGGQTILRIDFSKKVQLAQSKFD